jgi:STE24 endopeptidase
MTDDLRQQEARQYEARHNVLFLIETACTVALLVLLLVTGLSAWLAAQTHAWTGGQVWLATACYAAILIVAGKVVTLPLDWYGGFRLEHRYGLSNQSLPAWLWDETKSLGLSLGLGVVALEGMYFLLRRLGDWWWLGVAGFFILFGVVLSVLFPVVILPLFYKLEPLANESLVGKLTGLAQRAGARVLGVYRIGLSAKTKKANAALAGLGSTKRILLGDTLLANFTEDEIKVVLAHELAHYRHGDITKLLGWGAVTSVVGFWICDLGLRIGLTQFGFAARTDLGAFPLLALCLFLFGLVVMPVNHAFSRWRERLADRAALELTGNREGFIRAMRKLAEQNLADLEPHPAIEFFLHDHPSLARRIRWAEQWQPA